MQSIQWTTELISIISVMGLGLLLVGYALSVVLKNKQITALNTRLQQIQHEHQIIQNSLQARLDNAALAEQRLTTELTEYKTMLAVQGKTLDDVREQQHSIEKCFETTQAENRAQTEQIKELRERLTDTQVEITQERRQVNTLKDELAQEGRTTKQLEALHNATSEQLKDVKQQLAEQLATYTNLQNRYQSLSNEHTELKTTLERREEHFKEQMQQLSETKQSLNKEFENLANKIFDEKGKTFTQTSQTSIDTMLKPFREQIDGFQKRVNEVHESSVRGQTEMNSKIREVLDIGLKMSAEANNLTSALKGDSQQRGAWGEVQLRRTLEMSGLIEGDHYDAQGEFKDAEGNRKRPDYLIKLPDGKHIIIDSKVSLLAYDRAVSAETPEQHRLAMDEHIKAIKRHIDDLDRKDYTNLIGMRSPSFVLMFMPIEPAYIEALKYDKGLFEFGYKKNIVLVSHTTLIPILRTVSNLWMIERSNWEARDIAEKAGEIYNQVCVVAERLSKLGGTLKTVSNHYNSTVTALAGQQGLYGKVERFNQLSIKVSRSLPQIETSHADIDSERLAMIVEPIEEPDDHDKHLDYQLTEEEQEVGRDE